MGKELRAALIAFSNAAIELSRAWDDEPDFDGEDRYPFPHSFDTVTYDIATWVGNYTGGEI